MISIRNSIFTALFAISAFSPFVSTAADDGYKPRIFVYADRGACREGCISAVNGLARRNGYQAIPVLAKDINGSRANIIPRVGDLWIQPGGDALDAAAAMGKPGLTRLRNWIGKGLNYLGFCAGVFLADRTIDDASRIQGLNLIPFPSADFLHGRHEPMVLEQLWHGQSRWLYFQDGATFGRRLPPTVEVIATYRNGLPSVIETTFGQSRVVLSGVHPEAPVEWLRADRLTDPDGNDHDLADELFQRAIAP